MIRLLIIGLMFTGAANVAIAQEPWPLCINDHPGHRPPDCSRAPNVAGCITYGGLRPRRGYERDHYIPEGLCRGEDWCDVAAANPEHPPTSTSDGNVWYQVYPEYKRKDISERAAERAYCAGLATLSESISKIEHQWPRESTK